MQNHTPTTTKLQHYSPTTDQLFLQVKSPNGPNFRRSESPCAVRTAFMMFVAPVFTVAIAPPMLPVVSARKTMSGFGGIAGVDTVLGTMKLSPGFPVLLTDAGLTSARAGELSASIVSASEPAIKLICRG